MHSSYTFAPESVVFDEKNLVHAGKDRMPLSP